MKNECKRPEGIKYYWEILTDNGWFYLGADTFDTPEEALGYLDDLAKYDYYKNRKTRLVKTERSFVTREDLVHQKIMNKPYSGIEEMQF